MIRFYTVYYPSVSDAVTGSMMEFYVFSISNGNHYSVYLFNFSKSKEKKMKCPNTCSKFWMSKQTLKTLIWHHRWHCLKKDLHCCHRQIVKWTCSTFWTRLVIGLRKACWIKFPQRIFWNRFLIKTLTFHKNRLPANRLLSTVNAKCDLHANCLKLWNLFSWEQKSSICRLLKSKRLRYV